MQSAAHTPSSSSAVADTARPWTSLLSWSTGSFRGESEIRSPVVVDDLRRARGANIGFVANHETPLEAALETIMSLSFQLTRLGIPQV